MTRTYRPRHRSQLWRPVTGPFDCGVKTCQHLLDNASEGQRNVSVARFRDLMLRPGAQGTNVRDWSRAFDKLHVPHRAVRGGEWGELNAALRRGHGVGLCISYGVLTDLQPSRSGSLTFRGGHGIYLEAIRRRRFDGRFVQLSFDSLYDGRGGYPEGPQWVRATVMRRAAQAFSGQKGTWWGLIVPPLRDVAGPGETDDEEELPSDPDAEPDMGVAFPDGSDGHDLEDGADEDDD